MATSQELMTSEEGHTDDVKSGPLVSVHSAFFLIHMDLQIWRALALHILQWTFVLFQLITWLFCTSWSATADLDCSFSDIPGLLGIVLFTSFHYLSLFWHQLLWQWGWHLLVVVEEWIISSDAVHCPSVWESRKRITQTALRNVCCAATTALQCFYCQL